MKRVVSFLLIAMLLIAGPLVTSSFADSDSEAQTFLTLLNQRRTDAGLQTLKMDGELMDAAVIRAQEQSVRTSHYRPDGSYFPSVSSKVEAECYWWFTPAETGTAQAALNAFRNSRDHRELLMHKQVQSFGAAYYDASNDTRYWIILLSTKAASSPTGSSSAATPTPTAPSNQSAVRFSDVSGSDYFAESVQWAVQNGIVQGTGSRTFSPYQPCTRAQVVTVLWRAAGAPTGYGSGSSSFRDVPRGCFYDNAVAWAVRRGITKGTASGQFSPDAACTRAQAVTFLWRDAGAPFTFTSGRFADVPNSSYYAQAVAWAVNRGVTEGTARNTFSPDSTCTRAEFITFLYRLKH